MKICVRSHTSEALTFVLSFVTTLDLTMYFMCMSSVVATSSGDDCFASCCVSSSAQLRVGRGEEVQGLTGAVRPAQRPAAAGEGGNV